MAPVFSRKRFSSLLIYWSAYAAYWGRLLLSMEMLSIYIDYVHINLLKRKLVQQVIEWLYSAFLRNVALPEDLSCSEPH